MECRLIDDEGTGIESGLTKEEAIRKAKQYVKSGQRVAIEVRDGENRPHYMGPDGSMDYFGQLWGSESIKTVTVWFVASRIENETECADLAVEYFTESEEAADFQEEMKKRKDCCASRLGELDFVSQSDGEQIVNLLKNVGQVKRLRTIEDWKSWE
jgi:hypothetical protein